MGQAAQAGQQRLPSGDPGRHRGHFDARRRAPGARAGLRSGRALLADTACAKAPCAALQCVKLEKYRGTGTPVEIAEEFRHLTLQVIGESILSLTPEESDSVFPHLYLPIMARSPAWVPRPRAACACGGAHPLAGCCIAGGE